jgi:hypothetical protein
MPVVRQLEVEALREELAQATREWQRFDRIAGVGATLDRRCKNSQEWRAREADELAAAQLFQVLQVDTRATKVGAKKVPTVVESN